MGPVLLHGGLDYVGRHRLSDEVHQGVRGRHVTGVDLLVALTLLLLLRLPSLVRLGVIDSVFVDIISYSKSSAVPMN